MSTDRAPEIWSSRLQRELLSLTTSSEEGGDTAAAILPPFVTVKDHELDIEKGVCKVTFRISVEGVPTTTQEEETFSTVVVDILLDVSLKLKDGSSPDSAASYPFHRPKALLLNGSEHFPEGSTVQDGDLIAIDCDWTPSLHLNDAALNIALKIRESIKRREPFFKLVSEPPVGTTASSSSSSSKMSAFFTSLKSKAAAVVDELDQAAAPKVKSKTRSSKSKKQTTTTTKKKSSKSSGQVEIGDIIDLSAEPWSRCAGMYSCKAIRRPEFIEAAMANAASEEKNKVSDTILNGDSDENEVSSGSANYMALHAGSIRKVGPEEDYQEQNITLIPAWSTVSCHVTFSFNSYNIQSYNIMILFLDKFL